MGNFLGCFGGSDKSCKRRKQRDNVVSREQRQVVHGTPQRTISTEAPPAKLVSQETKEDKLSLSGRKRVTFDENITTYEHVSVDESTETLPEKIGIREKKKEKPVDNKPSQSSFSNEDGSVISSVGSFPPNHRYQNCKDSDDEVEEFDDSELDGEDFSEDDNGDEYFDNDEEEGEGKKVLVDKIWSETVLTESMESISGKKPLVRVNSEEVDSPLIPCLADTKLQHVRDRSAYIHPVLNPVENLSQWKALKSKTAQPVKPLKENFPAADQETPPRFSFSSEPTFDQSKVVQSQEIAVNASLSNWLVSPETTSREVKTSFSGFETVLSVKTESGSSNSVRSFEDRPILGALTVEELKQLSASASPRRSPSRSPDDIPIIGTVGTYWNDSATSVKPPSSFKGIPNTTSKYREDKRVNWHSTPFETRLERALNRGAA